MKETSDSAGITGIVEEPITGTIRPLMFDVDKMAVDENQLVVDGLAAQNTLARVRITLVKYEESPAHRQAFAPLLQELRSIVGR